MSKRRLTEEILVDLLYETAQELLRRIRAGEASPQDISNAIKLLHNNGITVAVNNREVISGLLEDLPFESDYVLLN